MNDKQGIPSERSLSREFLISCASNPLAHKRPSDLSLERDKDWVTAIVLVNVSDLFSVHLNPRVLAQSWLPFFSRAFFLFLFSCYDALVYSSEIYFSCVSSRYAILRATLFDGKNAILAVLQGAKYER